MECLHILALLSLAMVVSHAAVAPDIYWKSVLPNTPMPKAVTVLLKSDTSTDTGTNIGQDMKLTFKVIKIFEYGYAADDKLKNDPNTALFFLENDMHQGNTMNLHFTKTTSLSSTFLPREDANKIPFSSKKLQELYTRFSIKPNTIESETMKETIKECEDKTIEGEKKICATSLESMVDFCASQLGKKVKAISTEVMNNNKLDTPLQKYTIEGTKKLAANKAVVCHKQNYPYAVFYCHGSTTTDTYAVSLVGEGGTKVKAVAVCHTDTSKWNPKHMAFRVLKVKPGNTPVCHFILEEHVVWVPY